MILITKKLSEGFMKKNRKKQIKQEFKIEKVIKRKGEKLYVKWKGYNNSFNSKYKIIINSFNVKVQFI